jgi:hypothetical protein
MLLTVGEVCLLLGLSETRLANWRRPEILKDGTSNPRYLPSTPIEPGSRNLCYDSHTIVEFLKRPENHLYREHFFASLLSDQVRDDFQSFLVDVLPELPGINNQPDPLPEPTPEQLQQLAIQQSAWSNFTNQPQNQGDSQL